MKYQLERRIGWVLCGVVAWSLLGSAVSASGAPESEPSCRLSYATADARLESHRAQMDKVISLLPCQKLSGLELIEWLPAEERTRAMATNRRISLRQDFFSLEEWEAILIHELGHIMDLSGMRGRSESGASAYRDGNLAVWEDDPSVRFYRLSWKDEFSMREGAWEMDFVTGYAGYDPFEDFAESVTMYVLHGPLFRAQSQESAILALKYDFLREEVFGEREYGDLEKEYWQMMMERPLNEEGYLTRGFDSTKEGLVKARHANGL